MATRPKKRPEGLGAKKSNLETSPRPKARPDYGKISEGLATVESRADFDPALSWNPIARLGFEGYNTDKVADFQFTPEVREQARRQNLDLTRLNPDILDNAFYAKSRGSKEALEKELADFGVPAETRIRSNPDDIITDVDMAAPSTWAHEMTHRGFDRIIESINDHPEGPSAGIREFKEKYGEPAYYLLTKVDNEKVTEGFDYLEDTIKRSKAPEKTVTERDISDIKEMQRTLKADPEDRWKHNENKYEPYLKLMEAAQDILTASGEPPKSPEYDESMLDKLRIKLGFAEGGYTSYEDKPMGLDDQMQGIVFEVPSAPVEDKPVSPLSRRPGFRGESAFDLSGFGDFLKENVSMEELEAGLDNAASALVPFYDAGVNVVNVLQEYQKPEEERDYDYINQELSKAGESAAIEAFAVAVGGAATKYGGKAISKLIDKLKEYEFDPNTMSAFGVGSVRKKDTFEEVMTPVKVTKEGTQKTGEAILRPSSDLAEDLDPRLSRAMSAETAGSVMPGPGKFFDPSKKGYKGDKFVDMLKDADIELDLEFGNYIMMGKGKPQDVSNKTFENLFVSARPSQKRTTFGQNNKSVARANIYDGPDLSIDDMKANYKAATGKTGQEIRTNLLQPERFKVVTDEGDRLLDHPIVAVETRATGGQHFYTLDTQFVGPVRMDRLTQKVNRKNPRTGKIKEEVPQPNLRPATVGDVKLGDQIGTIRVGKKEHPLYDYIEVDATMSAPEGMGSIPKFNEGGLAVDDQMQAMFKSVRTGYALGGEVGAVEGETVGVDPVSGNEIPAGAEAKNVRDDIPAMLSEGEYVVPADVVNYYGVKFFEDLRSEAKVGMQEMMQNGRVGGEPVPSDEDLTEEEMALLQEVLASDQGQQPIQMAEGGSVYGVTTGTGEAYTTDTSPVSNRSPSLVKQQPSTGGGGAGMESVWYIHKDGRRIQVLMLNGKPVSMIPEDFAQFVEDTPANRKNIGFGLDATGDTETKDEGTSTTSMQDESDGGVSAQEKMLQEMQTSQGKLKTADQVAEDYEKSGVSIVDPVKAAKDALEGSLGGKLTDVGKLAYLVNPTIGGAIGVLNQGSYLNALSVANANLKMAEFLGKDEEVTEIKGSIESYLNKAPGSVKKLSKVLGSGEDRFKSALEAALNIDAPDPIWMDTLNDVGRANVEDYLALGKDENKTVDIPTTGGGTVKVAAGSQASTASSATKDDNGIVFTPGKDTVRPNYRPDDSNNSSNTSNSSGGGNTFADSLKETGQAIKDDWNSLKSALGFGDDEDKP